MVRVSKKIHIDRLECLIVWAFLIGIITLESSSSKKSLNNCQIAWGLVNDNSFLLVDLIKNLANRTIPNIDIKKIEIPILREKKRTCIYKVYSLPFVEGLLLSLDEKIKFERPFS